MENDARAPMQHRALNLVLHVEDERGICQLIRSLLKRVCSELRVRDTHGAHGEVWS